jgi:hypothetical protein
VVTVLRRKDTKIYFKKVCYEEGIVRGQPSTFYFLLSTVFSCGKGTTFHLSVFSFQFSVLLHHNLLYSGSLFRVNFYEIDSFANGGNVKQVLFGFVAAVEEVGFDVLAAGVQDGADEPLVDFGGEIQAELPGAGVRIGRE